MHKKFIISLTLAACVAGPALWAAPPKKPAPKKPAATATPKETISTEPVAKVLEIKSTDKDHQVKMEYKHYKDDKWFTAYPAMTGNLHDQYQTDAQTVAALQFILGGRVGINKDSVVEIVSERSIADSSTTTKKIIVHKGGIWAKVATQKTPLLIQTNGGVMGIKGTEFVIETQPGGDTSLGVLEGTVAYTDGAGKPVDVTSGQEYTTNSAGVTTRTAAVSSEELSQRYRRDRWRAYDNVIGAINLLSHFVPVPGPVYTAASWGGTALSLAEPGAAENYARDQAAGRLPGGLGGFIPRSKPRPPFPTDLCPDFASSKPECHPSSVSSTPEFKWSGVDGAKGYLILVASDSNCENVEWGANTIDTHVQLPNSARPLARGKHYWRVIPLNGEGEAMRDRKPTEAYFDVTP